MHVLTDRDKWIPRQRRDEASVRRLTDTDADTDADTGTDTDTDTNTNSDTDARMFHEASGGFCQTWGQDKHKRRHR